jgi:hypothetical protein
MPPQSFWSGAILVDARYLQVFFRWATPIDVVARTVPNLLERGIDPFKHEYASSGYPEDFDSSKKVNARLSDEFLEKIAQQYINVGRDMRKLSLARGGGETYSG